MNRSLSFALFALCACGGGTPPPEPREVGAFPVPDGALFKNADVVAYEVKNDKGAVIGRSHSTYFDSGEGSLQVLTRSALDLGGSSSSREVVTTFRPDLAPSAFKQLSSSEGRLELRFKGRAVSVITDARVEESPYTESGAVLIPDNDLMMLALALYRAKVKPGTSLSLPILSPRTLKAEPVPIRVWSDPDQRTVVQLPQGKAFIDDSGRISRFEAAAGGLVFERENPPGPAPKIAAPTDPPKYARPPRAGWRDREVSIDVKDGVLAGTLSEPPKTPAPGIIFLSGAGIEGPQDRNGFTAALDVGTWQILDRLAEEGFSVLRVDDRGIGRSTSKVSQAELGLTVLLDDAKAILAFMRTQPAVDPEAIFVIGHGQGAVVALLLAAEDQVAGVAALASPYRTIPAEVGLPKKLAKIEEDVAVFQGMKDYEVSWREDAKAVVDVLKKAGNKRSRLVAYENVDHLMKAEPGESSPRRYADKSRRVDEKFLEDLAAWLKEHAKKK
jgi:dienelactone hydrolase